MAKLTLDDIADQRAYERERDEFRSRVIALKQRRRIGVGPLITLVFENRDTVRLQVQEMARAERIHTDEGIQTELDIYNALIPDPGELVATLFIELTSEPDLREWLPKLVGIETRVVLRLGGVGSPGNGSGGDVTEVRCQVDPDHERQLTREEITASVHYVRFSLTPAQVDAFAAGPVAVAIDHPAYAHETVLTDDNHAELLADLRG